MSSADEQPWVLGISASHNGSVCLLRGDEIVVAIQEERLSGVKRHRTYGRGPSLATAYCLNYAGIDSAELDLVVLCVQGRLNDEVHDISLDPFLNLRSHRIPTLTIPHHYGHALSAFATSGFEESAILIVDGAGSPVTDFTAGDDARHQSYHRSFTQGVSFLDRLIIQERDQSILPNPALQLAVFGRDFFTARYAPTSSSIRSPPCSNSSQRWPLASVVELTGLRFSRFNLPSFKLSPVLTQEKHSSVSLLLEGKRAFVTGGTRGIGAAICDIFAREGADVAFSYNTRDDLADEMSRKIEGHGRRAFNAKVSVVDRVGMKKMTRELVEKWGGIDILVNNAAINRGDNFATTTDRAWDEVIHTNVDSLFAVTKPIYKQMIRQRKGIILNITSIGAMRALPTAVHYATSKAAMIGFTKCLSREAATFGVRVNAIAAGIFDTDLAQALPDRLLQMHDFWTSAGRLGRPEELAEYAAFMVSERNSFMNGEVVIVDGGAIT